MSAKDSKAARQAVKPILARIDQAESDIQNLVSTTRQGLGVVNTKVKTLQEVVNAIVEVVGLKAVQDAIDKQHADELQKEAELEKQGLDMAKAKNLVVPGGAVNSRSVIVGHEVDADGNIVPPGRAQLLFAQVKAELRAMFDGKKVGESVDTPIEGRKFIIDEIWDVVAKPTAEEAAAAAVDAALGADLGEEGVEDQASA